MRRTFFRMSKLTKRLLVLLIFGVASVALFYGYFHGKTFDNIPTLRDFSRNYNRADEHSNDHELIILYNRVPKTGSTSFMGVAYDLCRSNRFNVIHLNISKNSHLMSLADQARFIRNITRWTERQPAIYHGHVAFIDFTRFGYRNPIYINVIREPLERMISYYYFLRYGDDFRPHLVRKKAGNNETLDDCIARNGRDCDLATMWLQVPFFCGHVPDCWVPGNRWALERAKENLLNNYLIVGVTEELLELVAVLETTLPRFFKGATSRFANGKKSHLRKTTKKLMPSEATVSKIKQSDIWKLESEFYEFARSQFQFIKERILEWTEHSALPIAKKKGFHYEKIKPEKN